MTNWRTFAQQTAKLESFFQPKVLEVLQAFYRLVIEDLKAGGITYAQSQLLSRHFNEPLLPLLNDIYRKAGLMGAKLTTRELKAALTAKDLARIQTGRKGLKTITGSMGTDEGWIAQVMEYLGLHGLELAQNITDTTRGDIIKMLQRGIEQSLSIQEMVNILQTTGLTKARASVITRTEIIRAGNVGHTIAAKDTPYEVSKKWNAAKDHRTRHSHMTTNGIIVDENGFFNVPVYKGDKPTGKIDQMLFPGDPEASKENTINCRCRVTHNPKRDANGSLIMRDNTQAVIIPMRMPQSVDVGGIAAWFKSNIVIEPTMNGKDGK